MGRVAIMLLYLAAVGTYLVFGDLQPLTFEELTFAALASFKLARILTREIITECIRSPFCDENGSPLNCMGELFTCPYCMNLWTATAFVMGFLTIPEITLFLALILSVHAIGDFLHACFVYIRRKTITT